MPSFDIVSELNAHEVANAVDQASREVSQRFDFKGTNSKFELKESVVSLSAPADFQLKQMLEILKLKLSKRGIDVACLEIKEPVVTGQTARQDVILRQGVDTELGKKIQRLIKDSKLKLQAALQDKQVRVTGQEPRRPAVGDRPGPQGRLRAAASVHELPGLRDPGDLQGRGVLTSITSTRIGWSPVFARSWVTPASRQRASPACHCSVTGSAPGVETRKRPSVNT